MTPNQWSNLRQYIDLSLEIHRQEGEQRFGDKRTHEALERLRLRLSELETRIRESCEDPTHDA